MQLKSKIHFESKNRDQLCDYLQKSMDGYSISHNMFSEIYYLKNKEYQHEIWYYKTKESVVKSKECNSPIIYQVVTLVAIVTLLIVQAIEIIYSVHIGDTYVLFMGFLLVYVCGTFIHENWFANIKPLKASHTKLIELIDNYNK